MRGGIALALLLGAALPGTAFAAGDPATPAEKPAIKAKQPSPAAAPAVRRQNPKKTTANKSATQATARQTTPRIDSAKAVRAAATSTTQPPQPTTANASAPVASASPELSPNIRRNLFGPPSPPRTEMGDRPPPSGSLCGDGTARRFAEIDPRTAAALLPDFNVVRPRTICARHGVVIADYTFR